MPTLKMLDDKSRILLERVVKEIGRYGAEARTMRRGEIAAVAAALDVVLKYSARWICDQENLDPDTEIRRATRAGSFHGATGGQVLRLLSELAATPTAKRAEVHVLCREARRRRSRLETFIELRNVSLHEDREPPDPAILVPALQNLKQLITEHRRLAGFDA